MRRPTHFAKNAGFVRCVVSPEESVELPVFPGVLKHPSTEQLFDLLKKPEIAEKYTRAALKKAVWPILREFPRNWLLKQLPNIDLPRKRKKALEFLLH